MQFGYGACVIAHAEIGIDRPSIDPRPYLVSTAIAVVVIVGICLLRALTAEDCDSLRDGLDKAVEEGKKAEANGDFETARKWYGTAEDYREALRACK